MKKLILSFLLGCISLSAFSQTNIDLYASGASGSYTTGSATATTRTDDAIISTSTTQNGYAVFDLSSIPAGSVITASSLVFYVSSFTAGVPALCNTYGYSGDLSAITTPATLFSDITSGSLLFSGMPPAYGSYGGGVGADSLYADTASAPINIFLQANIGNKISIGFTGGGTNVYAITGESSSPGFYPILRVSYTYACSGAPYPGDITANVLTSCTSATVTVTNTYAGYAPGVAFQWQSSPDSATWTNVSGATDTAYTVTGFTGTSFYHCKNTCVYGGMSSYSDGKKIAFLSACCSGTPPVGVTTASTTYCSSCSLTLGLSGYPVLAGFSYQWQLSDDDITWSALAGATDSVFTFSPFGAYYYRCGISCGYSGLTSWSSAIFVGYQYNIVVDSTAVPDSTTCAPPAFYTKANGISAFLRLKTYYGDGTHDSVSLVADTATSYANVNHVYSAPGTYTVKRVLYYFNVAQDSVTTYYSHHFCNTLSVVLYFDSNGDCLKESDETYNSFPVVVKVDSAGSTIDMISVTSGFGYVTHAPVGTIYTFTLLSVSGAAQVTCPASGIIRDTVLYPGGTYHEKYVGLRCSVGSSTDFDLSAYDVISVTGMYDQVGNIYVANSLCAPENATVTLHYSKKYNVFVGWIDASPTPDAYTDSTITWNLSGISEVDPDPVDLYYAIFSAYGCCGVLTAGDTVNSYVTVSPFIGDVDTTNNYMVITDTVKAGVDPNEMSVTPSGCIASDTDGTLLQYTIHFTNIGNDTAFNIYAMDTLSDNVDPKSLQILMASNTMNVTQLNDGTHNIVKFDFPHINLLDSTDCPRCSGAVIFSIKTKQGLPEGAAIFNRAGIYFDYNTVVMTNTVEDIKGGCFPNAVSGVKNESNNIQIQPNPATDELYVQLGNLSTYQTFTITNSIGQQIMQQPLTQPQTNVNISTLPAGLYYITFRGENGTEVKKFVKL